MSNRVHFALLAILLAISGAICNAQAAESIVVVVKVFPTPGREDELNARYLKQLEFLRKAEPSASFHLHRSAKEPTTFLWYEVYESQVAYEQHLKVAMPNFRKEFGPTPDGLILRPSESETYKELGN